MTESLFERLAEHAKKCLLGDGQVSLMFHAHGRDGEFVVCLPEGMPPPGDGRAAVYDELRRQFTKHGVDAYAVCTESWTAPEIPNDRRRPAERPDRGETLIVAAIGRGQPPLFVAWPIVRDAAGRASLGEARKNIGRIGGDLFGLLPP